MEEIMAFNKKTTSKRIGSLASEILRDPKSSVAEKSLAGSALSQRQSTHQTGIEMEDIALRVLVDPFTTEKGKSLAGSVFTQAVKER